MRIALFSETYVPQRNGVALILKRLVEYLSAQGHETLIATAHAGALDGGCPLPAGCRLVQVPGARLPRYPDLTMAVPYAPRVTRAVREFRPDLVHLVTEYTMGLTGLRLARKLDLPIVASFHTNIPGSLPYYGFSWASEWCWDYLRWFHNHAGLTMCPSETWRRVLVDRGFARVHVWPRGVDTAMFAPRHRSEQARERNGPADAVQLLYVGRLTPEKDLPLLFRAYGSMAGGAPGQRVHLVLAGDGAYSSSMRSRAPADVTFLGYLESDALSAAYSSADVFVFPSRVETLGNVVLEAMASGLPVIGVDEGGIMENLRDGVNGLMVPAGDAQGFASAILRLASDQELRARLGEGARAWAEERTWDRAFGVLVESYRSLGNAGYTRPLG